MAYVQIPEQKEREKTAFPFFDVHNFYRFSLRPIRNKMKEMLSICGQYNKVFWHVA